MTPPYNDLLPLRAASSEEHHTELGADLCLFFLLFFIHAKKQRRLEVLESLPFVGNNQSRVLDSTRN